jgi:hypothetical protein
LQKFRRVGIEISIETADEHNSYVRQGTDTSVVLQNIDQYRELGNPVEVCLRPAVSALTIGYHTSLINFALQKNLNIKSLVVSKPRFLDAEILPAEIKFQYLQQYQQLEQQLGLPGSQDYNATDPNQVMQNLQRQIQMCIHILSSATPSDSEPQLRLMVQHCKQWDQVYLLDGRSLYPEFDNLWNQYDY